MNQTYVVSMSNEDIILRVSDTSFGAVRVTPFVEAQLRLTGGVPGPKGVSELALSFPIVLYVGPGIQPMPITRDMQIVRVLLAVAADHPPVGADLVFDILKNGVSIFTVSTPPTILDGETLSVPCVPDDVFLLAGDVLTVDILQVGSTQPGSYATLVLEVV